MSDEPGRPSPVQLRLLKAMGRNRVGYNPQEAAMLLWPSDIHKGPRGNGLAMAAGSLLWRLSKVGYIARDESYDTMKVYKITDHGLSLLDTIHAEAEATRQAAMAVANRIIRGHWTHPTSSLMGLRDAIKWAILMGLTDPQDQEAQALRIMATYRPSDWRGRSGEERLYQDILGAIKQAR